MKNSAFTQVIKAPVSQLIFISGQVAMDVDGHVGSKDFVSQLKESLKNVGHALCAAEVGWGEVVQLKLYVVDLKPEHRFSVNMEIKEIFDKGHLPTSTLIGVQSLAREDLRVEIEALAVSK